jgi:hypothetical protein
MWPDEADRMPSPGGAMSGLKRDLTPVEVLDAIDLRAPSPLD